MDNCFYNADESLYKVELYFGKIEVHGADLGLGFFILEGEDFFHYYFVVVEEVFEADLVFYVHFPVQIWSIAG